MAAAEAMRRGFFGAKKKAALGDGSLWIWGIVSFYLVGFTPILDFLHLLAHLYAAAQAAHKNEARKAWSLYVQLLKLAWAGNVETLLEVLKEQAERLGEPPEHCAQDDPRKTLARTVDYVDKNKDKMDYPGYRREGLPITSAMVESLIKQVSRRVKGTEKFWDNQGLEAILQVRAAYLSEDGRAEAHSERDRARHRGSPRGRASRNTQRNGPWAGLPPGASSAAPLDPSAARVLARPPCCDHLHALLQFPGVQSCRGTRSPPQAKALLGQTHSQNLAR
jgi:hypothetical protein